MGAYMTYIYIYYFIWVIFYDELVLNQSCVAEIECRADKSCTHRSVQNGSHPPRASFVQPTDQVEDYQALS